MPATLLDFASVDAVNSFQALIEGVVASTPPMLQPVVAQLGSDLYAVATLSMKPDAASRILVGLAAGCCLCSEEKVWY